MNSSPRIGVHIKCPNCGNKVAEGTRFKSTIELSCFSCWWRQEPQIEQWEKSKKKVYERMLNERRRKVN